jgi:fructose-1,6-bisphosphatase
MPYRRTTFAKFIIEDRRRHAEPNNGLGALLIDVQRAVKAIGSTVAYGSLLTLSDSTKPPHPGGSEPKSFRALANEIMVSTCEWGGHICGMVSNELIDPHEVPDEYPLGPYLLLFDPLDGASNIDVDLTVGTIFSVLKAPEGVTRPTPDDWLQPGMRQVAAGYALYGPAAMLVITLGTGVHGFTLDREAGAYTLTHPNMRIPETCSEFAIDASNKRFWEPPVRRYVEECIEGQTGPRGRDFNMRWIASTVAEVHRILIRGGLFMCPRNTEEPPPEKPGGLPLLSEANPMAMIVEQAGGLASTGRESVLRLHPSKLHQRVPLLLGSRQEVERLLSYHEAYDRGEEMSFNTPLFNPRSLFRSI